jgi:nitroreductase
LPIELVKQCRSYRRFDERVRIDKTLLLEMIEHARFSASAANRQPLKFMISWKEETNKIIFPTLSWAGYLTDWNGPNPGQRPTGYVIILGDRDITDNYFVDHGIAAQSMMLAAVEKGLGGCIMAAVDRDRLRKGLGIPERFDILLVLALGKPDEVVRIDEVPDNGDIRYWRDDAGIHHVPKRSMDELVILSDNVDAPE